MSARLSEGITRMWATMPPAVRERRHEHLRRICAERRARIPSFRERLWNLIAGPWIEGVEWDDCWLFVGGWRSKHGYGRVKLNGRSVQAHVAAFIQVFGPIAPEHVIRHACDVPLCCNPFHLAPGTHTENERDKEDKAYAWACTPLGEPPRRDYAEVA